MKAAWYRALAVVPITAGIALSASIPRIDEGLVVAEVGGRSDLPDHGIGELIDVFCLDCHGARRAVGGVDLEALAIDPNDSKIDPELLLRVRDRLRARDMPPIETDLSPEELAEARPSDDEYLEAVRETGRILAGRAASAGVPAVTVRRLGRRELAGTLEELFGAIPGLGERLDMLPSDDVGHGFDHLGEVLSTSPLHVEKMFDLAEFIAARVVVDPRDPVVESRSIPLTETRGGKLRRSGAQLNSRGEVFARIDVPRPGRYRAEFDLAGQQAGDEPVRFGLRVDRSTVRTVDVPEDRSAPASHAIEFDVEGSSVRIGAAFVNDFFERATAERKARDRNAIVMGMRLVGPLDPGEPSAFQKRLDSRMSGKGRREGTAQVARDLLERCWGRRIETAEAMDIADRLIATAGVSSAGGVPTRSDVQRTLVVYALMSPEFLYRVDRPRSGAPMAEDGSTPLDGHSIARRLASFLRGGPPDARLMLAARRGTLEDEHGLLRETRRLLRGDAPRTLAERFAVQWLHVDGVEGLEPDPERFGDVSTETLADMREETIRAFEEIVREDRPITDLFDSSTTWISPRLAAHYGWDPERLGVRPEGFTRVDLAAADVPQASLGVLRHASVLMSTSNSTRTSPVKRGKWVLESLLDCPPPPPPPGVDQLPSASDDGEEARSLREMLEAHRADPDCASCHVRMDALGFAMEPLDAVGRWRSMEGDRDLDAAAVLPDGTRIDGPFDLRDVLVRDPALLRSFAKHLLVFALGRGPEWRDEPLIDEMVRATMARPTVAAAVEIIVLSDAFRRLPADVPDP
ncbi:MAG: DUF1592 domain-containing protein [Phycisphaera sp.]|nr:DUF1592 domain-containing protein [Phycisphaera sp.]